MKFSVKECEFKEFNFCRNDAFWRNLICITYTWVISGSFLRYRMQVTEKHNFMDIFYINCFSHFLYLSRERNISCFSCFLTIIYAIYSRNWIHLRETAKQKRRGDMYKAKERKWGRVPRWCLDHWIYALWFILWRFVQFSLFVLKQHIHVLGFVQIISVFRMGWRYARVGVGYPVSGTCSCSPFCKWRTGACLF